MVVIFVSGLGAVAHFGIVQSRNEASASYRKASDYTVRLLAARLSQEPTDASSVDVLAAWRRILRTFSSSVPARCLRIVDESRRIIVSTDLAEVGQLAGDGLDTNVYTHSPIGDDANEALMVSDRLIRVRIDHVPLAVSTPTGIDATEGGSPSPALAAQGGLFLEARLPPDPYDGAYLADQARTLAVVLVVLGALFVVYRCARSQFRGVNRIALRLRAQGDRIADDLGSLRIVDTASDITDAWNKLVVLVQELQEAVSRTKATEELSRVLERSTGGALSEALNAIPDGIIYLGVGGRFEYINSTGLHFFAWDQHDVEELTIGQASSTGLGERVLELIRGSQHDDGSFSARVELVHVEGNDALDESSFRVWIIPLPQSKRAGECVVVIRDVSQQIRADRSREEFVTQVTHELRTPLTNIRAYAETLSAGMFDDPNVITECYNVIMKETRRLSRLIEDMLSISQLEVGSIELEVGNVDLETVLTESVRDVRGLAEEKSIDLQLILPAKLEPIVADRDKLGVVINNILGNALKYTPSGGVVVVGCQVSDRSVSLTVKDDGIGIAQEDQARIFEKFQRAIDPDVQNETGTGIGLYTAREIARRHGGDIEVVSTKGEGATFIIRLPQPKSRASALCSSQEG